jgi:[acyl-carrier-protein] S-malonyltransferase
MANKIALLFSGQGAQQVGMGKDLSQRFAAAANRFAEADSVLGYSLSQIAFEGPLEKLTKTSRCQAALFTHGIAILDVLREQLGDLPFAAAAGLSLGEFSAHAAARTFDFPTGLRLVANRGQYMDEACQNTSGTMAAFIGGDEAEVMRIARAADVDVANLNSPGQIVLSGEATKIRNAIDAAKQHGIKRALPLNVGGAFHSRLMISAQKKLESDLSAIAIRQPMATVIANVTAAPAVTEKEIRRTLAEQITGTVRWTSSIEYIIDELGCDLCLELGPGQILAGLVSRIRKGTATISIGDLGSLDTALPCLRSAMAN